MKVIPGYSLSGSDFWRHSLAAAFTTESLRMISKLRITPLAFTAALLHDIGKVVLGQFLDTEILELLEKASRNGNQAAFRAELEILSMHHGEVGGVVAQHWGLPELVAKVITFHHTPELCNEPIVFVTHFANAVAHQAVPISPIGRSEAIVSSPDDVSTDIEHLGLPQDCVPKVVQAVCDRLSAVAADYS